MSIHRWVSHRHPLQTSLTLAAAATEVLRGRREETAIEGNHGHGTLMKGERKGKELGEMMMMTLRTPARQDVGRGDCARMPPRELIDRPAEGAGQRPVSAVRGLM